MGYYGVQERNVEGQMVLDCEKTDEMIVVNTHLWKSEEHRVTYKSVHSCQGGVWCVLGQRTRRLGDGMRKYWKVFMERGWQRKSGIVREMKKVNSTGKFLLSNREVANPKA